jgi:hypothetical protein
VTDEFTRVLSETLETLREAGARPLAVGELASAVLARQREGWIPRRIELFLLPDEAEDGAAALSGSGYAPAEGRAGWRHAVARDGIVIELAYRQPGDVYVDEEMLERGSSRTFEGVSVPLISAEDLLVLKALLHGEDRPREWWDALAILERDSLDWDYLVGRAQQYGAQRILSLLAHARSLELDVPRSALSSLFGFLEERRSD